MPARKSPTLQDVADRAGVSRVAVSVVLSGAPSKTQVSAQTRTRILEAAHGLNYHPNRIARSLLQGRTDIIGVYLGHEHMEPRHPFLAELLSGLHEQCQVTGQNLLLLQRPLSREPSAILSLLMGGIIDGLVMVTPSDDPLLPRIAETALPAVLVADTSPLLPSLLVDDGDGFRQIIRHLASRSHRRVLYLGGEDVSPTHVRRYQALVAASAENAVTLMVAERGDEDSEHAFRPAIHRALALPPDARPTALISFNDVTAHRALDTLHKAGVSVPGKMAVTGFDGFFYTPGGALLTTVQADWAGVGRLALQTLREGGDGMLPGNVVTRPVTLLPGDTT